MQEFDRRNFLRVTGQTAGALLVLPASGASQNQRSLHQALSNKNLPAEAKAYGAIGDGKAIDSAAINTAIEALAKSGGGTLHFSAGEYLCYSIHLRSNVGLYLDHGAVIIAADPLPPGTPGGYDEAENPADGMQRFVDFGHSNWHDSLLWGEDLHDISITGPGRIWGRGLSNGFVKDEGLPPGYIVGAKPGTPGIGFKAIALKNCRNVTLGGFQILNGGWFGLLATGVDNLVIDGLTIDTSRDGMDIDCCRNVRISNCAINSPWDDAIVPKSSYALGYNRVCENIAITNCYVTGRYQLGSMLDGTWKQWPTADHPRQGRIKFGTESNGGFKNVAISNCVFDGCRGFSIESEDGAIVEDFTVTNLTMRDVFDSPIFLRLGARLRGPTVPEPGRIRRILISNIVSSNSESRYGVVISGIPGHPIEDVRISNLYFEHKGGGSVADAARKPLEKEQSYPEPEMFGTLPSSGFFVRHVKGLEISDVKIVSLTPDQRPTFFFQDVTGLDLHHLTSSEERGVAKVVLHDVEDCTISRIRGIQDAEIAKATAQSLP